MCPSASPARSLPPSLCALTTSACNVRASSGGGRSGNGLSKLSKQAAGRRSATINKSAERRERERLNWLGGRAILFTAFCATHGGTSAGPLPAPCGWLHRERRNCGGPQQESMYGRGKRRRLKCRRGREVCWFQAGMENRGAGAARAPLLEEKSCVCVHCKAGSKPAGSKGRGCGAGTSACG